MALSSSAVRVAEPIRVEPAYSDREAVWQKVVSHGPYPLMAGSDGYVELIGSHPRKLVGHHARAGYITTDYACQLSGSVAQNRSLHESWRVGRIILHS